MHRALLTLALLALALPAPGQNRGASFVQPGGSGSGSGSGGSSTNAGGTFTNLLWSNTYWVDATNGNDATSIFGDASKPARTPGYAISNAPTTIEGVVVDIRAGHYPVTARQVNTNGQGTFAAGGINILSRQNKMTIRGVPGQSILDSASTVGELFWISNSPGLRIEGLVIKGFVITNYPSFTNGVTMAGVSVMNVSNFYFERNEVIDHFGHGLWDLGDSYNSVSTNNCFVRWNRFENIGSSRTNASAGTIFADGTGVVPGAWTVEGNYFTACLVGVEPFGISGEAAYRGCVIRNNVFVNNLIYGIHDGSATNCVELVCEGNRFWNQTNYTRRGSNIVAGSAAIHFRGDDAVIRNNDIGGEWSYGIDIPLTATEQVTGTEIEGNYIHDIYEAANLAYGIDIHLDTSTATPGAFGLTVRGNKFSRIEGRALRFYGVRDSVISDNQFINPYTDGGGHHAIQLRVNGSTINSNILVLNNRFYRTAGVMTYALFTEAGGKAIRFFDNETFGATSGIIDNNIGAELRVRFLPKLVFPAYSAGVYVNAEDDTDITHGAGAARTNRFFFPYNGHKVRVRDGTSTIATNIVLMSASGIINGGNTNLGTNFASGTLTGDGTNWNFEAAYP